MAGDPLIEALPDLVALVRRNGVVIRNVGGRGLPGIAASGSLEGRRLDDLWGEEAAQLLLQLLRKSIAQRQQVEGRFLDRGRAFEARMEPQGPDRVLCVIRAATVGRGSAARGDAEDTRGLGADPSGVAGGADPREAPVDRRGFFRRFQQSVADAALREQPLAVSLVLLRGLADIGRIIDFAIAEKIATAALQRLQTVTPGAQGGLDWYVGQLGEGLLGIVIEGRADRRSIGALVGALCDALAEPVAIADASFQLSPCAGIALLGQDAKAPQALLDHARAAMLEARRSAIPDVRFYSDTLRMRPTSRLDFERELRGALEADQLRLRYVARHRLRDGSRVAVQAYLRWPHPLRGEVRPEEFLAIAHGTGLSLPMSRWALDRIRRDMPALRSAAGRGLRVSFGPLRHHLTGDALAADVEALLATGELAADELELRLAERVVASLDAPDRAMGRLADLGVSLMIDEFARSHSVLSRLAYLPFATLQVDRSFVRAVDADPAALKICVAVASVAKSFGMTPVAAGVDGAGDAARMLQAGYVEATGDHFGGIALPSGAGADDEREAAA